MSNTNSTYDLTIDGEHSYGEWLTDMASAIREKNVKLRDGIKPVAFPSAIRTIESPKAILEMNYKTSTAANASSSTFTLLGIPDYYMSRYWSGSVWAPLEISGGALGVGAQAFYAASNLSYVSLDYCKYFGNDAFKACSKLAYAYIPNAEQFCQDAFQSCSLLASGSLGSPRFVETGAFENCSLITNDMISFSKVEYLGNYAIDKCSLLSFPMYLPQPLCLGFNVITGTAVPYLIAPRIINDVHSFINEAVTCAQRNALRLSLVYLGGHNTSTGILSIGANAFTGCTALKNVIFYANMFFATNSSYTLGSSLNALDKVYIWSHIRHSTSMSVAPISSYLTSAFLSGAPYASIYMPESIYEFYSQCPISSRLVSLAESEWKRQVKEICDEATGVDTSLWGEYDDPEAAS